LSAKTPQKNIDERSFAEPTLPCPPGRGVNDLKEKPVPQPIPGRDMDACLAFLQLCPNQVTATMPGTDIPFTVLLDMFTGVRTTTILNSLFNESYFHSANSLFQSSYAKPLAAGLCVFR